MPVIKNFNFGYSSKSSKKKLEKEQQDKVNEEKYWEGTLELPIKKEIQKEVKVKFSRQELLVIKAAMKFFQKLNNDEDDSIQKVFGLNHTNFFRYSHSIFNKLYKLSLDETLLNDDLNLENNELFRRFLSESSREFQIKNPPEATKIKREDLITELRKMSKQERKEYWDKLIKGK